MRAPGPATFKNGGEQLLYQFLHEGTELIPSTVGHELPRFTMRWAMTCTSLVFCRRWLRLLLLLPGQQGQICVKMATIIIPSLG